MSFFHKKKAGATTRKRSDRIPIAALESLGCLGCGLDSVEGLITPKMPPSGPATSDVFILMSRPSKAEDAEGSHCAGEVSSMVRNAIPSFYRNSVVYDYTMRCHSTSDGEKAISYTACCRKQIASRIQQAKPKVIIAVGSDAMKWCGAKDVDPKGWRGRYFPVEINGHKCLVKCTVDPLYVWTGQRINKRTKERIAGESDAFFRRDIRGVFDDIESDNLPTLSVEPKSEYLSGTDYVLGRSKEDLDLVKAWFADLEGLDSIAIDYETSELRPYSGGRIISAAVGDDEFTFAFPVSHVDGWRKHFPEGESVVQQLLADLHKKKGTKVYHNSQFDLEWAGHILGKSRYGLDITRPEGVTSVCTQVLAYMLDSRKGMMKLDVLVFLYFGFFLKEKSAVDRANAELESVDDLLKYNAMDTKYTYKLWKVLTKEISKHESLLKMYGNKLRAAPMLVSCQSRGIILDYEQLDAFSSQYRSAQNEAIAKIAELPEIKKFATLKRAAFNPTSPHDAATVFRDILQRKEGITPTGGYTTNDETLKKLAQAGLPLAELMMKVRETGVLLGTFIDGMLSQVHKDGLLHTNYMQTFTSTGRLSSRDPNAQNFPKRKNKKIRNIVKAPEGFSMTSNDYGQIEARIFAMASKDKEFTKALWENLDVHMDWAIRIANAYDPVLDSVCRNYGLNRSTTPEAKIMKTFRGDIKNQWVFPQFFGSSPYSCAKNLNVPDDVATKQSEIFWQMFAGVKSWQERTVRGYRKNGYVETLNGFRRYGPISYNMQINSPIQGCLQKSSFILTKLGLISIGSLVGKTFDAWTGFKWASATALDRGECQLAEIELSSGLLIKCDTRHKLKNGDKDWVEFKDLKEGDLVALPTIKDRVEFSGNRKSWAFLLGAYLGDGSYRKKSSESRRFDLCGADTKLEMMRELEAFAIGNGWNTRWRKVQPTEGRTQVRNVLSIDDKKFHDLLDSFGVACGATAHTKKIPTKVWTFSLQEQADFLQGLRETGGCRQEFHVGDLHMCSKPLLQEVQILAASVGWDSQLSETKNGYLLRFRGLHKNNRSFPFDTLKDDLGDIKVKSKLGDCAAISEHAAIKNGAITQPVAERIYEKYLPDAEVYRYDTIKKITVLDEVDNTYTLSVDDPLHQFVADGVIHKNTASEIVVGAMCELSELASSAADLWFLQPCLNIHDDITSYIPDDKILEALKISAKIMCHPDFDFINVPLVAEMEAGKSWGSQKALGEYYSNDGWKWNKGQALSWADGADGYNELCDQLESLGNTVVVLNDKDLASDLVDLKDVKIILSSDPTEVFRSGAAYGKNLVVYDPESKYNLEDLVNTKNVSSQFYHVPNKV